MKEFIEAKNENSMELLNNIDTIEDQVGYLEDKGNKKTKNMRKKLTHMEVSVSKSNIYKMWF